MTLQVSHHPQLQKAFGKKVHLINSQLVSQQQRGDINDIRIKFASEIGQIFSIGKKDNQLSEEGINFLFTQVTEEGLILDLINSVTSILSFLGANGTISDEAIIKLLEECEVQTYEERLLYYADTFLENPCFFERRYRLPPKDIATIMFQTLINFTVSVSGAKEKIELFNQESRKINGIIGEIIGSKTITLDQKRELFQHGENLLRLFKKTLH